MTDTEKLWQEYHNRLLTFIKRQSGDAVAAEDILQEVFIKIHQNLETLKESGKLESWLYQITRNTIIDHFRRARPHHPLPDGLSDETTEETPETHKQLSECLAPLIQQLPDHYRKAIELSELQGYSQQQLADHLGISLSGAKSRTQRGRLQLKKLLSDCCRFEFDRYGKVIDFQKKSDCYNC